MRTNLIVLPPPRFDGDLGLLQGVKDFTVEQLIAELAVEALDKPYTSRHCFTTRLLEAGCESHTAPELLDDKDVKTTMGSAQSARLTRILEEESKKRSQRIGTLFLKFYDRRLVLPRTGKYRSELIPINLI